MQGWLAEVVRADMGIRPRQGTASYPPTVKHISVIRTFVERLCSYWAFHLIILSREVLERTSGLRKHIPQVNCRGLVTV